MTDITNNSNFLEGKPRGSVILKDLIDKINQIIQDELIDPGDAIETEASILTATGVWLDYIGDRLEYPRPYTQVAGPMWFGFDGNGFGFDQSPFTPDPGLNVAPIADESYRALLLVRGSQLITDGSIPNMDGILTSAFESGHYIDHGDMTMDVVLDTSLADETIKYTVDSGLVTKPAGVKLENIFVDHIGGSFGFDGNGLGFDQALFIRVIDDL